VRTKIEEEKSVFDHQYKEKEEHRINLNDLLKRSKDEKTKTRKNNFLVFSAVLTSAVLVLVLISLL